MSETHKMQEYLDYDIEMECDQKGKFKYWRVQKAMQALYLADPKAKVEIKHYNALPYLRDDFGVAVFVDVTMHGVKRSAHLPVLDHRNKPLISPDWFQIHKTLQRCKVNAIAMHGLGLTLWTDVDDEAQQHSYTQKQHDYFMQAINKRDEKLLYALRNNIDTEIYIELFNGFPRGKKVEMKQVAIEMEKTAHSAFEALTEALRVAIEAQDSGLVLELIESEAKPVVVELSKHMTETEINYIKGIKNEMEPNS
jgi:hypothetical protein